MTQCRLIICCLYVCVAASSLCAQETPLLTLVGPNLDEKRAASIKEANEQIYQEYCEQYQAHGVKGPWDPLVLELLKHFPKVDAVANAASEQAVILSQVPIIASVGCDDPLVQYFNLRAMRDAVTYDALEKVLDLLKQRGYNASLQFMCARRAVNARMKAKAATGPQYESLWQSMPDLIAPLLSMPPTIKNTVYVWEYCDVMWNAPFNSDDFKKRQFAMLFAACDRNPKSEWWRFYLQGRLQIKEAWKSRGNGVSGTVTTEGWKGFSEHLALARENLTKAWTLDARNGMAADDLITVAMGDNTGDVRTWFERSISADPLNIGAYDRYIQTLSPRWGGSTEQLLAFAVECVQTKAFFTKVPRKAISCIQWAVVDAGDDAEVVWRDPRTWTCVDAVTAGEAKYPMTNRKSIEAERMVFAWFCGKTAEAARLWKTHGAEGAKPVFDRMYIKPEVRLKFNNECRDWDVKSMP